MIEDSDFGVRTSDFGLDRRVEMYQWQRDGRGGYQQVWKPALVSSSNFSEGHANPSSFPLEGRIWWATEVSVDGKPLDASVIKTLGQWQDFRPSFTRLPANLAATFQPEGDGLGSALNPLDPRIGDLRIHWRTLHLPPLADKIELRGGKWQLVTPASSIAIQTAPVPVAPSTDDAQPAPRGPMLRMRTVILGGLFLLALLLVQRARRRPRKT